MKNAALLIAILARVSACILRIRGAELEVDLPMLLWIVKRCFVYVKKNIKQR